jgi:ubiquitin carboxyl-terminal hydrolase 34
MDEVFLSNTVRHLVKALLNTQLMSESFSELQELQLAAVLVGVLLEFLRGEKHGALHEVASSLPQAERPAPETSAGYFSDDILLVDRLMSIVSVSLQTPDLATIAQDSYAAILEASLHSRAIWAAFIRHPELQRVHQILLLTQSSLTIRENITRKIASICGGDLPSTCPVTRAETASQFWKVISAVLPQAGQYAEQSKQLFELAEHVFRTNDEYDRNEDYLRSLLLQWGTLLLNHEHKEFPGQDKTDYVILGLTKLLLSCIMSIKSFKKPVNAGSLMKQVFQKYIFVSRYVTLQSPLIHIR